MIFNKYGLTFIFYCSKVVRTLNEEHYFFECNIRKDGELVREGVMYTHSFTTKLNSNICNEIVEDLKEKGILNNLMED